MNSGSCSHRANALLAELDNQERLMTSVVFEINTNTIYTCTMTNIRLSFLSFKYILCSFVILYKNVNNDNKRRRSNIKVNKDFRISFSST